jgi:hypothetical protein
MIVYDDDEWYAPRIDKVVGEPELTVEAPSITRQNFQRNVFVRTAAPHWIQDYDDAVQEECGYMHMDHVHGMEHMAEIFEKYGENGYKGTPLSEIVPADVDWTEGPFKDLLEVVTKTLSTTYTPLALEEEKELKRSLNVPFLAALNGELYRHKRSQAVINILVLGTGKGNDFSRIKIGCEQVGVSLDRIRVYTVEADASFRAKVAFARQANGNFAGVDFFETFVEFFEKCVAQKSHYLKHGVYSKDYDLPKFDLILMGHSAHHVMASNYKQMVAFSFFSSCLKVDGVAIGCYLDVVGSSLLADPATDYPSSKVRVLNYNKANSQYEWGTYTTQVGRKIWPDPDLDISVLLNNAAAHGYFADVYPGREAGNLYAHALPKELLAYFKKDTDMRSVLMMQIGRSFNLSRAEVPLDLAKCHEQTWVPDTEMHSSIDVDSFANSGLHVSPHDIPYLRACEYWVGGKLDGKFGMLECHRGRKARLWLERKWYVLPGAKPCALTGVIQVEVMDILRDESPGAPLHNFRCKLVIVDFPSCGIPGVVSFQSRWKLGIARWVGLSGTIASGGVCMVPRDWERATPAAISRWMTKSAEGIVLQPIRSRPGKAHHHGTARYLKKVKTVDLQVVNGVLEQPKLTFVSSSGKTTVLEAVTQVVHCGDGIVEFAIVDGGEICIGHGLTLTYLRHRPDKQCPNTAMQLVSIYGGLEYHQVELAFDAAVHRPHSHHFADLCPGLYRAITEAVVDSEKMADYSREAYLLGSTYCSRLLFPSTMSIPLRHTICELRYRWYNQLIVEASTKPDLLKAVFDVREDEIVVTF